MKRTYLLFCAAVLFSLAGIAGEGKYACSADAQECLNKMVQSYTNHGWLGIEMERLDEEKGYFSKITKVIADSPAYAAGFKTGDVLVAVNGVTLSSENEDAIKKIKHAMVAGKEVKYTVKRGYEKQQLTATLASPPEEVLARWVGGHLVKAHAEGVEVASN